MVYYLIHDTEAMTTVKDPTRIRVSVIGDLLSLPEPRRPWREHFGNVWTDTPNLTSQLELEPVRLAFDALNTAGRQPSRTSIVVSLPTIESTFINVTARGPQGWDHSDYPALYVTMEMLNADEGYFWVSSLPL